MIDGPNYRAHLIGLGLLRPAGYRYAGRRVLKIDDAGSRAAAFYMKQGDFGATLIHVGPEHWRLAPWHVRALEMRSD